MMDTPNTIRSEIGFTVWLGMIGWKHVGGRGAAIRLVKRLVHDPETFTLPANEPRAAEQAPDVLTCHVCGWEINGGLCHNAFLHE